MTDLLFTAILPMRVLNDAIASAKSISDTMHLHLDAQGKVPVRYWAVDANRLFSVEGKVLKADMVDGDSPTTIQIQAKLLEGFVKMFSPKKPVTVSLEADETEEKLTLIFEQPKDETEVDRREATVEISEVEPVTKVIPTGGYAQIDLQMFNKVLTSFRRNTDTLTVEVAKDLFRASLATRRLEDGWQHPTTTKGRGKGLFSVRSLQNVIMSAARVDRIGEIYVVDGYPLLVEVGDDSLSARYYAAEREGMRDSKR